MVDKTLVRIDLGPLPFRHAIDMIKWCFEHNVDRARCMRYIDLMSKKPSEHEPEEWFIMIPENLITFFAIRWS